MTKQEMAGTAENDLDYLRALAEEGQHAPLLGGRFALLWGILLSLTLTTHWLALTHRIPLGIENIGLAWFTMGITGGVISAFLGNRLRLKPGAGSVGNRVSQHAWTMSGWAIFTYAISIVIGRVFGEATNADFDSIMPMAFCIYAIAYFTTGKLSGNKNMTFIAAIALIGAAITGALIHQSEAYLVATLFVVLTSVIPGIIMMRREPAQTV
jgi:hypothetical protein